MTDARQFLAKSIGFGSSNKMEATIASGQTTATTIDLGRPYATITIRCADCSHIPASTTLSVKVADDKDDVACAVYDAITGVTLPVGNLPTTGTYRVVIPAYCRSIILALSQAASGGNVVFEVYGYDPVISVES